MRRIAAALGMMAIIATTAATSIAEAHSHHHRHGHHHHHHSRPGFVYVAPWYPPLYGSSWYFGPQYRYPWYGPSPYEYPWYYPSAVYPPVIYRQPVIIPPETPPVYIQQQPAETSYWYYCSEPAGFHPYVAQCTKAWLKVIPSTEPPK